MFKIHCLVDDSTLDAATFLAEHGLALAIETFNGLVLFDTGQSGTALVHNAENLGLDLSQIDAIVLSHAHYDHTGGLEAVLQRSRSGLSIYAHPDLFCERYTIKSGRRRRIGLRLTQEYITKHATLKLSAEPIQVLPGVWTTGEIKIRTDFEGRSSHHYIKPGTDWRPDPYRDDMGLVLEMQSGLILVCGCCHAGLLNVLAQVQHIFNKKIVAILGGAHLADVDAETLDHVIATLRATSAGEVPYLYLSHCTGEQALATLKQAFGERVNPCPAGTVLSFG